MKNHDLTGWVIKIPEEESPHTTEDSLRKSAYDFNVTPKGRRYPVKTIAETCEIVSSRVHKENRIWPQTKEPVLVIRTNNQIPFEQ